MKDLSPSLDTLRVLNSERLNRLYQTPVVGLAFDVHGFTFGKNPEVNKSILNEQARLLELGCVLAAVTGFGDRIHLFQTKPLLSHLERRGLNPSQVPLYLSTRNGALTTHAYKDEIIDHHPITSEMYDAITSHPLVEAVQRLVRPDVKAELAREYAETSASLGFELHPRREENPGIRHDWHPGTRAGYQLTVIYEPDYLRQIGIHDEGSDDIRIILEHCGGSLPDNPHVLAPILKQALAESGLDIATNTAGTHPEIDIALPGINKAIGCSALLDRIAGKWNIGEEEARKRTIGGGDSPKYNDRPLIKFFDNGVTNIYYWDDGVDGPIVLDYQQLVDPVERTLELFRRIKTG
ncbi:MAG: hypothetical protein UV73_C0013G0031 [Candidatus Gottesmanbacteria bacterium GW2011_GWA2_43_14]|uniref:Uncharacterized protein n=1 Tax=Candidatus Gottesmanbacteria bacterium GW2011_GWA2_43_14 TaxID=1618443 RepID=A0A0G1FLG3_9BACT|nr:MAG: hypothetical protein UV73_C0013G0031 [Candidatus Gottesmanbacteria bacterium GW2011_GWA2_43_14]